MQIVRPHFINQNELCVSTQFALKIQNYVLRHSSIDTLRKYLIAHRLPSISLIRSYIALPVYLYTLSKTR